MSTNSEIPSNAILLNNDVVEATIIGIHHPNKYLMYIEEYNIEIEKEARKTGVRRSLKRPSYKEGGMTLSLAITSKRSSNGLQTDYTSELASNKQLFTSITMLPPEQFLKRGWNFTHERKGGKIIKSLARKHVGFANMRGVTPCLFIDDIYPSPCVETYFEDGIPKLKANEINENHLKDLNKKNQYLKVMRKEENRQKAWDTIIKSWQSYTEKEAIEFLLFAFSSRLLLHDKNIKNGVPYYSPTVGMKFNALVERKGKHFNLVTFKWNKDKRSYDFFNKGVDQVTEEDIMNAEKIIEQRSQCFSI